jgi:hypothetical protein
LRKFIEFELHDILAVLTGYLQEQKEARFPRELSNFDGSTLTISFTQEHILQALKWHCAVEGQQIYENSCEWSEDGVKFAYADAPKNSSPAQKAKKESKKEAKTASELSPEEERQQFASLVAQSSQLEDELGKPRDLTHTVFDEIPDEDEVPQRPLGPGESYEFPKD